MPALARELPADLILREGEHSEDSQEFCAMEAVAFVAGEPWSDHPECACPVIATFIRSWNDTISDDAERTRLLTPLIPKLVGSRGSKAVELSRAMLCVDWSAAWSAATEFLRPTVATLQDSALKLIDRMLAIKD